MKTYLSTLIIIIFLILSIDRMVNGQGNVGISNDSSVPDQSAMLDVKSTNKGLLIPRMTITERNSISDPAKGLLIFQINEEPGFYFNSGVPDSPVWQKLNDATSGQWMINGDNIYYLAGKVGIGTDEPEALLHVHGIEGGNVLFTGRFEPIAPGDTPVSGEGTRMMWYPDKAAFRAGQVEYTHWDKDYIGDHSTAFGNNTIAEGDYSLAIGQNSSAVGSWSIALGQSTYSSGEGAFAFGAVTSATGNYSAALGYNTNALGEASAAIGSGTLANGNGAIALGQYTSASGNSSTAMGMISSATGEASTAMGKGSSASGDYATAMGESTCASGNHSTAMGYNTTASGHHSTAMGHLSQATQKYSTAMGSSTLASGWFSLAVGLESEASGDNSTAIGENTIASGYGSIAMGLFSNSSGDNSTSLGSNITAKSAYETVVGRWNTDYVPANLTGWNASDRLFVIGNGTGSGSNSNNAMTVLKNGNTGFGNDASEPSYLLSLGTNTTGMNYPESNTLSFHTGANERMRISHDGNVGIGTTVPAATLHVNGTGTGEGNVLFAGALKSPPGSPPAEGAGTRMMWYPDKAAFRAGRVTGTHWDMDSIGIYSIAFGADTKANGIYSTALGHGTAASGERSTAMGYNTIASGNSSMAMGRETSASGSYSMAIGRETSASGSYSMAMGSNTTAKSGFETVIGLFNTDYVPANSTGWNAGDRLFVIGNGSNSGAKSNAFTVLKNGHIGIGNGASDPSFLLTLGVNTTGINYPTPNTLSFHTNDNERMRISSNGNLGIDTDSPTRSLSFGGNSSRSVGMEHRTSPGNGYDLVINAGGSSEGANYDGGDLWFQSGRRTGNGSSHIFFETASPGSSGTGVGNPSTKMIITGNGNVGIGTTSPHLTAALEVAGTTKGFLPPRMTLQQRDAITDPAEGLLITCTNCLVPGLHQFINGFWVALSQNIYPAGDYNTVVNPVTGKTWLDRNLGASQVATSSTDAGSYGDLYQWGRGPDGHEKRNSSTTTTEATNWFSGNNTWEGKFIYDHLNWYDDNDVTHMWKGTNAENNPCPSGFRIPTNAEWNQERLTWSSNDAAGAFASPLKLPMAGWRSLLNGVVSEEGTLGAYWSSTGSTSIASSRLLDFNSSDAEVLSEYRGYGFSVRCIKD